MAAFLLPIGTSPTGCEVAEDAGDVDLARVGLTRVLAETLGVPGGTISFARGPCYACGEQHGKPYTDSHDGVSFSLSRCRSGWGFVAVGLGVEVGADIEDLRSGWTDDEATYVLSRRELAEPRARENDLLTRQWVRKEAYLKGLGVGLNRDMATVELRTASGRPGTTLAPGGWQVLDVKLPGPTLIAAVAMDASSSSSVIVNTSGAPSGARVEPSSTG